MKKLFPLLMMLSIGFIAIAQQDTIVQWTFPTNDGFADGGLSINLLKEINTDGGTSAIQYKNGHTSKAAQTTGWHNGAGTKQWLVEFSADGYENLHVSSILSTGGSNPGPRDFVMEFKIDCAGIWAPIPGGTITTANDWTTGAVVDLVLPPSCADAISLFIRWRMLSDTANDGSLIDSTGTCKIDDIFITGAMITGIEEASVIPEVRLYPNPASESITILSQEALSCTFVSLDGRTISSRELSHDGRISLDEIPRGLYFLIFRNEKGVLRSTQKLLVQ